MERLMKKLYLKPKEPSEQGETEAQDKQTDLSSQHFKEAS